MRFAAILRGFGKVCGDVIRDGPWWQEKPISFSTKIRSCLEEMAEKCAPSLLFWLKTVELSVCIDNVAEARLC